MIDGVPGPRIPSLSVATTILNKEKHMIRTIQTSDNKNINDSMQEMDGASEADSREISTVNTNRLK